jgi:hypothetical protein
MDGPFIVLGVGLAGIVYFALAGTQSRHEENEYLVTHCKPTTLVIQNVKGLQTVYDCPAVEQEVEP